MSGQLQTSVPIQPKMGQIYQNWSVLATASISERAGQTRKEGGSHGSVEAVPSTRSGRCEMTFGSVPAIRAIASNWQEAVEVAIFPQNILPESTFNHIYMIWLF